MSSHPAYRPRRLRRSAALRRAFAETPLAPSDLIAPVFLKESLSEPTPIGSMPGQLQHTLESLVKEARETAGRGLAGFVLFGVPEKKDPGGSEAFNPAGISQRGIAALKEELGDDVVVISDLCLCEYTDHGHCGLLSNLERGTGSAGPQEPRGTGSAGPQEPRGTGSAGPQEVDNDRTLEAYARTAVAQAEAGADVIAPSGMMDGQVEAIRAALDEAGHSDVAILAYAAKYASDFYGPFRQAAEGAPRFGDRRGYQQDPSNAREALREVRLDIEQGADAVMVKPALPYLDVVRMVKDTFEYPTAAYNVSGEYAMVMAAAERGWLDERKVVLEVLTSIRRAGADLVVTYHAKRAAEWLT
jgi:porphobilinogen synthase